MPEDQAAKQAWQARAEGIAYPGATWQALVAQAKRLGVALPEGQESFVVT